ncbi:MAG: PKD domain-containing protein [Solirubrobacterales bacterium]|nr:PKD domain-containing protein [Solirubrobacterales bacterium]
MTLSAIPQTASAAVVSVGPGKSVSYQPLLSAARPTSNAVRGLDFDFLNLDYNGGDVMAANTNYTIYWRPTGAAPFPAGYKDGVDRYFIDLAHDSTLSQAAGGAGRQNVDSVATQYNDSSGNYANYDSYFGDGVTSRIDDTNPYPTNGCAAAAICLSFDQLEGIEMPGGAGRIIYSADPYVSMPDVNGCDDGNHPNDNPSDGLIAGGLSHEHNEAITDPIPNTSWADFGGHGDEPLGNENGDKCRWEMGTPDGATPYGNYNQTINGNHYWYQTEWSNYGHACLQRLTTPPILPAASFTNRHDAANTLTFTAASVESASYVWQFNETGLGGVSVETLSPQITHEFPSSGDYRVALTVMNPDGASTGAAHNVATGARPPSATFVAPSPLREAAPATFDGSASSAGDSTIISYVWAWGDSTPDGSGVRSTHTFAAQGTYTVTLTVTDSSSTTASVTQDVTVAAAEPPVRPPRPPSKFSTTKAIITITRATAVITTYASTPSAGALFQRATTEKGSRITTRCRVSKAAPRAAVYKLLCRLSGADRAELSRGPRTLRLKTLFTPRGRATTTRTQVIMVSRARRGLSR